MKRRGRYIALIAVIAVATFAIAALLMNIARRQEEGRQSYISLAHLSEDTIEPAEWGKNFPRQYDGYRRTVDTARTKHGGSEAFQRLEADPRLLHIFAGYAFSIDYREERGHAYTLRDQDETERVKKKQQFGNCLHCHASIIPAYRKAGGGDVMKGFAAISPMPWAEARKLVSHPVACLDCHDPKTMQLRVTRPGFLIGIAALKKAEGVDNYDPNKMATRQEMRSFVCGQCHVEYHFLPVTKLVTYPWKNGLKVEDIEAYYDEIAFSDWTHAESGAGVLKAQHPEFEMWSQNIHARSGVACADCHMPYMREGAVKISDHHVRSPLLNIDRACLTCHPFPAAEMRARAELIQDRNAALLGRAEEAVVALIEELKTAREQGVPDAALEPARKLHRRAQFRADFVNAENSMGFHASQEAARILGEAIDYARQGQMLARVAKASGSAAAGSAGVSASPPPAPSMLKAAEPPGKK